MILARRLAATFLALAALMPLPVGVTAGDAGPQFAFPSSHPPTNAAMDGAQGTLALFLAAAEADDPETEGFSVRLALSDSSETVEHVWASYIGEIRGGEIAGVLINQPDTLPFRRHDPVAVPISRVSDWTYWRDRKMEGGYTIRVMVPSLGETAQSYWRSILAPLPEPAP